MYLRVRVQDGVMVRPRGGDGGNRGEERGCDGQTGTGGGGRAIGRHAGGRGEPDAGRRRAPDQPPLGRCMVKVVPSASEVSTSILPLCAVTISSAM